MRAPAKTNAADLLPDYNLGLGENCRKRVESLFDDLRFHTVGTWGGVNGNVSEHILATSFCLHLSN